MTKQVGLPSWAWASLFLSLISSGDKISFADDRNGEGCKNPFGEVLPARDEKLPSLLNPIQRFKAIQSQKKTIQSVQEILERFTQHESSPSERLNELRYLLQAQAQGYLPTHNPGELVIYGALRATSVEEHVFYLRWVHENGSPAFLTSLEDAIRELQLSPTLSETAIVADLVLELSARFGFSEHGALYLDLLPTEIQATLAESPSSLSQSSLIPWRSPESRKIRARFYYSRLLRQELANAQKILDEVARSKSAVPLANYLRDQLSLNSPTLGYQDFKLASVQMSRESTRQRWASDPMAIELERLLLDRLWPSFSILDRRARLERVPGFDRIVAFTGAWLDRLMADQELWDIRVGVRRGLLGSRDLSLSQIMVETLRPLRRSVLFNGQMETLPDVLRGLESADRIGFLPELADFIEVTRSVSDLQPRLGRPLLDQSQWLVSFGQLVVSKR